MVGLTGAPAAGKISVYSAGGILLSAPLVSHALPTLIPPSKPLTPISKECRHEAANFIVVPAASFLGMPVERPSHIQRAQQCPKVQPASPYLSLHLQLHREGYSLRGEANARVGAGAANGPASDSASSRRQGARENADDSRV